MRDLRPTALDQLGLIGAVTEFVRKFDDDLEISLDAAACPLQLPAAVEVATYRIVTEAVTNVVRHAGAERCWLTITAAAATAPSRSTSSTTASASATRSPTGVGWLAMRERAAELGGRVELRRLRPHGTHLHVELPAGLS